ncbi:MAG: TdeIII family type II restriction endonuclease [Phototrophicales bacterium]|nr:MAG: TdeIII family type II restriction endonuclease [Phototrophicales bacterium]
MSAISDLTRAKIKAYLEVFIERTVDLHRGREIDAFTSAADYLGLTSAKGRLKPFHAALLPQPISRISAFERSLSTTLGMTFEECARLIALDHHVSAQRGYDLTGTISLEAIQEIEQQTVLFERAAEGGAPPAFDHMIKRVISRVSSQPETARTVRVDLFVQTHDGRELYFELKSPVPNKGQCIEVIQRILRIHALRNIPRPQVQAYFAMAYNPFGSSREDYRWSIARQYLPFDQAVVIGDEFWTLIGGETAYIELLDIYREVGEQKAKYVVDALAFGF